MTASSALIFLCFAQAAHHETLAWKHPDIGMHIQKPVTTVIGHLTLMFATSMCAVTTLRQRKL